MPIYNIDIMVYKVLKDVFIEFSLGCNIIIGENATGKTQLLNALLDNDSITDLSLFRAISVAKSNSDIIYIPVKDMLTHSKGLVAMSDKYKQFPFDKNLIEIVRIAQRWELKKIPYIAKNILPKIEPLIEGSVVFKDEEFFIQKKSGELISFNDEAEGYKKIGLLWQLLMNESIKEDTVILWDEPEANLNPKFIPDLVEILLELSRNGVQLFVTTHSYVFAKYFEIRKKDSDNIAYHSLYKNQTGHILCETNANFKDLKHNAIMESFEKLLDEVYDLNAGE